LYPIISIDGLACRQASPLDMKPSDVDPEDRARAALINEIIDGALHCYYVNIILFTFPFWGRAVAATP